MGMKTYLRYSGMELQNVTSKMTGKAIQRLEPRSITVLLWKIMVLN
jgi:hypothetical protein